METNDSKNIAAAYIRVSTNDQTELSPDAQLRVIREAAKADSFQIPEDFIFIEKRGISGRHADNRPEFQRMIAVAKSQKPAPFHRLYLWKFSRFARNQDESTFYKSILRKKCGVDIKSVSEPVMEGMFGRLIETIIEWFDEYYSINLSEEVLRGMTEKALRHGYQTSPCFGYAAAGGGSPFLIVESEIQAVEYMFQAFHDGTSPAAIARELNERQIRTKRNRPFNGRAVRRILQNPFYVGTVIWNGYRFHGTHEVNPTLAALFEDNQKRLCEPNRRACKETSPADAHWLSGLLICGYCGTALSLCHSTNHGRSAGYFQCRKYAKGLHKGSCSVSVQKAERLILAFLQQTPSLTRSHIARIVLDRPGNCLLLHTTSEDQIFLLPLKEHSGTARQPASPAGA
ncbi:MAG: recombinase family protein [Lachnospiraceae bacterium]|nr:recombinase family protein [Lachnospiraceae bacterium]